MIGDPAVMADQGFVEVVRLDVPELRGRLLLGAVAAEAKERDIAGPGLSQVLAEGLDDVVARGLLIGQGLGQEDFLRWLSACGEQLAQGFDIVHAAPQRGNGREIAINTDKEGMDGTGHG